MQEKLRSPRAQTLTESLVRSIAGLALVAGCASSSSGGGGPTSEPASAQEESPPAPGTVAAAAQAGPIQDRPDMQWWRQSMQDRDQRIAWFREARFGMFVHWGAYSHVGGVWEGKPVEGYAEHIMRKMKIPTAEYQKKLAAPFNPTEFNADEWVSTLKRAGMAYLIITAKHHDGFAMYDSQVSDYNVVKVSAWKRDPMKELKEACKKHGVRFGFYYSQAWEWHHPDAPGNDWEYDNPAGERKLFGQRWWETNPELVTRIRNYVDGKVIPQVKELVAKYDPDIMWFDTPGRLPPEENIKVLKAVRAAKPTLVVNSRICQPVPGGPPANFGDYFTHHRQAGRVSPARRGVGGHPHHQRVVRLAQDGPQPQDTGPLHPVAGQGIGPGGNVLLNIGPMGNGKFEQKDVDILNGVGEWMKQNGQSIQGTERTPLPVQAWGESTRRDKTLYLHVLSWPKRGRVVVGGLKSNVKRAYLLSQPKRSLEVKRLGQLDVVVQGPARAPDASDTVIALELAGEPAVDRARLLSSEVSADSLRAFDGELRGQLAFGQGKTRDAYVQNWKRMEDSVRWPVRLREGGSFEVAIAYDAEKKSAGGTFAVKLGATTLTGQVTETPAAPVSLGRVTLPAGNFEIAVEPTKIQGDELLRLRSVTLTPAPVAVSAR